MLNLLLSLFLVLPIASPIEPLEWENRVYLASFPGSGNHWVRYMLEEATQTATSSVYDDPEYGHHAVSVIFPWGGYCCDHGYNHRCRYPEKGDYFVVKTHSPIFPNPLDHFPYKLTIRLVRHPVDCFYSFYTWNPFSTPLNPPPKESLPRELLHYYIDLWRNFELHWNAKPNVLTIRYEDLMENQEETFIKIMEAIPFNVSVKMIKQALYKYPPEGKVLKHLHRYSEEDLSIIKAELGSLMEPYGYRL